MRHYGKPLLPLTDLQKLIPDSESIREGKPEAQPLKEPWCPHF